MTRKMELTKNTDIGVKSKEMGKRLKFLGEIRSYHEELIDLYVKTFEAQAYMKLNLYKYNFPTVKDLEKEFESF